MGNSYSSCIVSCFRGLHPDFPSFTPQPHPPASLSSLTPQPHSSASLSNLTPQPHSPASLPSLTLQPHSPASLPNLTPQPHSPTSLLSLTPQPHSSASLPNLTPQPHSSTSLFNLSLICSTSVSNETGHRPGNKTTFPSPVLHLAPFPASYPSYHTTNVCRELSRGLVTRPRFHSINYVVHF